MAWSWMQPGLSVISTKKINFDGLLSALIWLIGKGFLSTQIFLWKDLNLYQKQPR